MRALQLPDPTLKSYFLTLFGRSERVTACACERSGEVTMPQLLHLQNGEDVVQKIRSGDGRLAALLKKSDAQVIEELFLGTLSRAPKSEERDRFVKYVESGGPTKDRKKALADVFWALLNSSEFMLNH